jgi:hypothetical protein
VNIARAWLVALLLAGCGGNPVQEISSRRPLLTVDWRGDQSSGVRCIVEHLSELKWTPEVQQGPVAQVIWNGPSAFWTKKPIAVFEVTGATASTPGKIVMHAVDVDEPDRVRQAWLRKIASCSP